MVAEVRRGKGGEREGKEAVLRLKSRVEMTEAKE